MEHFSTGNKTGRIGSPHGYLPIEEHGIVGDLRTVALIGTDGTVGRLEADKRADARIRQSIARDALAGLTLVGHPSSYFVWLPLAQDARADRIAAFLARKRISVATAEPYTTSATAPQALRLALGSADLDSLRRALTEVREVVEADPHW